MGGAAFLFVAFLLRAPQEGTPPANSTDQSTPRSQILPPAEPLEPDLASDQGEETHSLSDPSDAEGARAEGSAGFQTEGARNSASAVSAEDVVESETEREEDAGELNPPAEALGALSKEAIDDGVRDQIPEILQCYQGWLRRNPDLEGTINVKFVIATSEEDPDLGYVREVDLADTTIGNVWMEGCVLSAMQDAEFEAPDGGVVIVRYPFEFSSDDD